MNTTTLVKLMFINIWAHVILHFISHSISKDNKNNNEKKNRVNIFISSTYTFAKSFGDNELK